MQKCLLDKNAVSVLIEEHRTLTNIDFTMFCFYGWLASR